MTQPLAAAIIGGSGLYAMDGLADTSEHTIDTPFGSPSSPIITGTLEGKRVAFLARHGLGHFINPSEVNSRANIYALKSLGATRIISISACGSLREDYKPGDIVILHMNHPESGTGAGIMAAVPELKRRGLSVRINTDGQANLVHGRNILPELTGLIDTVSVSLNAADPTTYQKLCNTPFGAIGFYGVCDFISGARSIPTVIASAVTLPGLDVAKVQALALSLGARFRERPYNDVG